MSDRIQIVLLIASVIAGMSGWAAVFAWWFRERSKTVRAIKELRRTNTRLQKTVMFTLDKWRDQVMHNQRFLSIEREYVERIAAGCEASAQHIKEEVRAEVSVMLDGRDRPKNQGARTLVDTRSQFEAIDEVERYAKTGWNKAVEFEVEESLRKAA